MKLYNRTRIPDELLIPILTAAGRHVGARTGKVVVKVTRARHQYVYGRTYKCAWVARSFLDGRGHRRQDGEFRLQRVSTDHAYVELIVGRCRFPGGGRHLADKLYEYAMHEWAHAAEDQDPLSCYLPRARRSEESGRRVKWAKRPEEVRAIDAVHHAQDKVARGKLRAPQEALDRLALWLEEEATQAYVEGRL